MTGQYYGADRKEDQPAFLYHLGDIVYHFGEAAGYADQFLAPFECYPAPIYAIAGNHDTDVNPDSEEPYESLEAFSAAFCNTSPKTIYFGEGSNRKSQIQPHIYWTMESPLSHHHRLAYQCSKIWIYQQGAKELVYRRAEKCC